MLNLQSALDANVDLNYLKSAADPGKTYKYNEICKDIIISYLDCHNYLSFYYQFTTEVVWIVVADNRFTKSYNLLILNNYIHK